MSVAACPPVQAPARATQLVTVQAASAHTTVATLRMWQRSGTCWRLVAGPWTARLGANGVSAHKHEGDGTTPIGTFAFGPVVYGTEPNPGVARYHRLVCGDWWDEDPSSPAYNTFVHVPCGRAPPFGGDSEALWRIVPQYRYFAVIEYNAAPVVAGRGSAIFLHVAVGPTAGCVSLPQGQLERLLRRLRPGAFIRIGIS